MQPEFIYFLQDDTYKSYYVDNGIVKLSATGRPLEYSPAGWQEIALTNARNSKYFALDRSFSIPLSFVEDGALIVKTLYYTLGFEAKVNLVICRRELYFSDTEYGFYYKLFYKGELDLANFKHDGEKVTCNILEGGLPKLIKANENVKYEIAMDAPVKVKMDGIRLHSKTDMMSFAGEYEAKAFPPANDSDIYTAFVSLSQVAQEGTQGIVSTFDIFQEQFEGVPNYAEDTRYFLQALESAEVTIDFNFLFNLRKSDLGNDGYARLQLWKSDGAMVHQFIDQDFGSSGFNSEFDIKQTLVLNLAQGDKLFIICAMYIASGAGAIGSISSTLTMRDCTSTVRYTYRYKTTYVNCITGIQLFKKLVEKIGGGKYTAESALLMNEYKSIVFTSGDAIRGLTGATIKTSLADFFAAVNVSLASAGMAAHGDILKLETKDYFIDHDDVIDIGNASNLKVGTATEYLFNTLKVGYAPQNYEDINGREEFNNTLLFTAPITRVTKELNLVSPYRADSYGIEFTRMNLEGKTSTDDSADNDVFMLHIGKFPASGVGGLGLYYNLDRTLNASATGLTEPETIFNLFLSPKRCMIRNGSYIHSAFFNQETLKLEFQSTDKNSALACGGIIETDDVEIAGLGERFFVPVQFEFTAESPVNLIDLLDASPMKIMSFNYNGFTFKMVPVKVSVEPASRAAQTFTGLALATNDFTQLIDIYE